MRQRVNATPVVNMVSEKPILASAMEQLDLDDNNILDSLETTPELERVFRSLRKCIELRQKYMIHSFQMGTLVLSHYTLGGFFNNIMN